MSKQRCYEFFGENYSEEQKEYDRSFRQDIKSRMEKDGLTVNLHLSPVGGERSRGKSGTAVRITDQNGGAVYHLLNKSGIPATIPVVGIQQLARKCAEGAEWYKGYWLPSKVKKALT